MFSGFYVGTASQFKRINLRCRNEPLKVTIKFVSFSIDLKTQLCDIKAEDIQRFKIDDSCDASLNDYPLSHLFT